MKIKITTLFLCTIAAAGVSLTVTRGGWTGAMNGTGYGWGGVNVVSSALRTNAIRTTNMIGPSAAMSPELGYSTNAFLPNGASTNTLSRIKGTNGYVWQATTFAANGDKTDNPELETRIVVHGADCPSLTMDSTLIPDSFNGKSGAISVKTVGTAGTALWLRGFEVPPGTEIPVDDPNTPNNETADFLKTHGAVKFENLLAGPFEYGVNGKCELIIYFTLDGDSLDNLIMLTDGVAKSNEIELTCPEDQVVTCGQSYTYPLPQWKGGCGEITFTYAPAVQNLVLGANTVTLTAKDGRGDEAICIFKVTVTDVNKPVPDLAALPKITGLCSATITTKPTATDDCSGKIIGKTLQPLTYTQQGVYTNTWTYTDAAGNTTQQNQIVEVADTIAPAIPVLADVLGSFCSPVTVRPPTTTDNCAGIVTGTTTTVFPISAVGTNVVTWRFTDGRNTVAANQRVIISGYTFVGFDSPIGAVGGDCTTPAKDVKAGSVNPIKFQYKCGETAVTSGPAPVVKVELWKNCVASGTLLSVNAVYLNDWHANWDTTGWAKGVYKIIVELPDGSKPFVFVNLK
jgi:hypothetical protein